MQILDIKTNPFFSNFHKNYLFKDVPFAEDDPTFRPHKIIDVPIFPIYF